MKLVKFYAWEDYFIKYVGEVSNRPPNCLAGRLELSCLDDHTIFKRVLSFLCTGPWP
jgi:hypothetical protein